MAYSLVQPKQKKKEPYHKNHTAAHHSKLVDQARLKLGSRKRTRGRNVIADDIFIWLST